METKSKHVLSLALLVLVANGINIAASEPSVKTNVGTIEGISTKVSIHGREYTVNNYLGIPFAKPPVGELRFAKPEPADKFETPFQATSYGKICPQSPTPGLFEYDADLLSEDCLSLNVFVTDQKPDSPKGHAVMVWIHGGGFYLGSSREYRANTMMSSGNVIFVSIQYRLGFFGFASSNDSHAPGNVGLWDQHLALTWVNENIGAFGGDNSRVTIVGESAGGISVGYQSLFPQNKGLFQRGIQESGTAAMAGCYRDDIVTPTEFLAENLNCSTDNSEEMVKCMKNVDYRTILATMIDIVSEDPIVNAEKVTFMPTLDNDFFKISPLKAMRNAFNGKDVSEEVVFYRSIDIMTGANSHEGAIAVGSIKSDNIDEATVPRETMDSQHVPFAVKMSFGPNVPKEVIDIVIAEYTNWESPDDPVFLRDEYIQLMGDIFYISTAIESSIVHSNATDVNTYQYVFRPRPTNSLLPTPKWLEGANHGDEVGFVFGMDDEMQKIMEELVGREFFPSQEWERSLATIMVTYWTNFAKSGNPNKPIPVSVEWPKYTSSTQKYMSLDKGPDGVTAQQYLSARRANLFLKIVPSVIEAINNAKDSSAAVSKQAKYTCSMATVVIFSRVNLFIILGFIIFY